MRKLTCIAVLFLLIGIYSAVSAEESGDAVNSTSYSEALYYKNLAIQNRNADEKRDLFDRALQKLENAEKSGGSLGRVYHQMSEIHYLKGDIASSEKYALLAIDKEKNFFPPYNRLYGFMMEKRNYKGAAKLIEDYLAADPDEPYALYLLGVHYFKYLNDSDRSLKYFEREISISKSRDIPVFYLENSYYNAGYIFYSRNDFNRAFTFFSRAYNLNQSNRNTVYMLALSAFGYNNIPDTVKYSEMYLKIVPGEVVMEYLLGSVYYMNGSDKALGYLSRVRRSKTFEGLVAMGLYYELTGDDTKAESVLNSVQKYRGDLLTPYIAIARIRLRHAEKKEAYKSLISAGTICFRNNAYDAAENLFYKALEIKSDDNSDIFYFLARTHEENRNYSMAISYYNRYYSKSNEVNILVHIGYIYGTQKNYAKAHRYFQRALSLDSENPGAYFFKGLVQIWEGRYSDSGNSIRKAISLKGDEETYYFYLAIACEKLNDVEKAVENLRQAIKYNKNSARAYNYLGYLYADRNMNLDEAFDLVKRALELNPDEGAYLDSLGWVYYRKGDYNSALKNLLLAEERLEEEGNTDYVVYDHIGDTYLKLENRNKALFYWEKALKMEKNSGVEKKIKQYREQKNEK